MSQRGLNVKEISDCRFSSIKNSRSSFNSRVSDGRNVAVAAVNDVRTWALDREVFQNIMRRTAEMRHEQYRSFLRRLAATYAQMLA